MTQHRQGIAAEKDVLRGAMAHKADADVAHAELIAHSVSPSIAVRIWRGFGRRCLS
jgi:hypothetical protein